VTAVHAAGPRAATALALALLAGCGGGAQPHPPATSKASFLKRANAICRDSERQLQGPREAVERALRSGRDQTPLVAFVRRSLIPSVERELQRLRALRVPPRERATVVHLLALVHADLRRVRRRPAIVAGGHPFSNFALRAYPYGLTDCAKLG
jgi:hypothetical protein